MKSLYYLIWYKLIDVDLWIKASIGDDYFIHVQVFKSLDANRNPDVRLELPVNEYEFENFE